MTLSQQSTTLLANLLVAEAIEMGHDVNTAKWWLDRQDRLAAHAQQAAEYRKIKKVVITETDQNTHTVRMEIAQ